MDIQNYVERQLLRRTFLGQASLGLGAAALASMLPRTAFGEAQSGLSPVATAPFASRGVVNPLHFAPRVKRVIFLCMAGGPSQFETFDEKPKLAEMNGEPMPESFTKGQPIAQLQGKELRCLRPLDKFRRHGESGQNISDLLPYAAKIADDICIIRSMQTEQ